jgi:hypothetical protein
LWREERNSRVEFYRRDAEGAEKRRAKGKIMGGNWFQGPSACAKQKEALHERSNEYDAPTELGNDRAMLSAIDMALLRELVVGYIDGAPMELGGSRAGDAFG